MAVRATARATGPDVAYVLFNAWYLLAGYAALTLSPLSDVVAGAGRGASPGSRLVAVAVRNALTCYLGYAPWHWYLYGGDKPPKIAGRKFNVRTPPPGQHARDRFWTCVGFAISALIEYAVGRSYASAQQCTRAAHRASSACRGDLLRALVPRGALLLLAQAPPRTPSVQAHPR